MNYVGIDWAYGRAAWCALSGAGEIESEGLISADEDGLARLALEARAEVNACVEMMSGAIWVKDQLELCGWSDEGRSRSQGQRHRPAGLQDRQGRREGVGRALQTRAGAGGLGRLARKTARSASVFAAALTWSRLRTSARNRIFGLLTQFGLRVSLTRLRQSDAMELLERRGVPDVWCDSIAEHLDEPRELASSHQADRLRARPDRRVGSESEAAADDPRVRALDQPHLRLRDRRRLALLGLKAGRLCRPGAADHPVGRAFGDRAPLEGRLADAALGRGRGGQPGLATDRTPSTSTTAASPLATAPTQRSQRSRESC